MRKLFEVASLALCLCVTVSACQRGPESTAPEDRGGKARAAAHDPGGEKAASQAVRVPLTGARIKGSDEALVTIVELSDYQCPYCKKAHETVESLLGQYGDRVRLAVFDKPLPFHTLAAPAAKWAHAAGQQGKYWPAREMLFERQRTLHEEDLAAMARDLGLDSGAARLRLEERGGRRGGEGGAGFVGVARRAGDADVLRQWQEARGRAAGGEDPRRD